MRVWIVKDLEPIAADPGNRRLMRAGMLAQALADAGHDTTWFTSSFDHYAKCQRAEQDKTINSGKNLTVQVLAGPGYKSNISFRRILHNRQFARSFREFTNRTQVLPDVLVTDIPTTETAAAVVDFGLHHGIPTVVSIRDLWPDFFTQFVPRAIRPLVRLGLLPLSLQAKYACGSTTSLIGISETYLKWGQRKGRRENTSNDAIFPLGYNVVPFEMTRSETYKWLAVAPDTHIVAFVGSWGATYDLDLIADTAEILKNRPDICFVISGDSETRPELAARLNCLPNVRLVGWLSSAQIAALLHVSSVGLLSYTKGAPQGLPNKVFEYMAYGAFQVSTLDGETAALYSNTQTGVVVEHTVSAVAGGIVSSLDVGANSDAREQRKGVFESQFAAGHIYRDLVRHIEKIAGNTEVD